MGQAVNVRGAEGLADALMARILNLKNHMTRYGAQRSVVPVTGCTGHLLLRPKTASHMRELKRWDLALFTVWPDTWIKASGATLGQAQHKPLQNLC